MKVVKTTEHNGYVDYHVDQILKRNDKLTVAGVRVARLIERAGLGLRDSFSIHGKLFTIGSGKVTKATFCDLVLRYGDKSPVLTLSWSGAKGQMRLIIETNIAFSDRDFSALSYHQPPLPYVGMMQRLSSRPTTKIAIDCGPKVDKNAVEELAKKILG